MGEERILFVLDFAVLLQFFQVCLFFRVVHNTDMFLCGKVPPQHL